MIILRHILKEVDCDSMNWNEHLGIGLMVHVCGEQRTFCISRMTWHDMLSVESKVVLRENMSPSSVLRHRQAGN
jgi:hypothetical protein